MPGEGWAGKRRDMPLSTEGNGKDSYMLWSLKRESPEASASQSKSKGGYGCTPLELPLDRYTTPTNAPLLSFAVHLWVGLGFIFKEKHLKQFSLGYHRVQKLKYRF